MAKRRGNGEGCVRLRKDGRWLVEFQTGIKSDGKPAKIFRYFKTQAEAIAELNKLKGEFMVGVDHAKGAIKTGEWCWKWLDTYKQKLKPSTRASYQTNIRCHIDECVGGIALNKLTSQQIQHMLDGIIEKGGSYSLFEKVHNVLSGALSKAVELEMITKNPCDGVGFPDKEEKEVRAFTLDEQRAFINALKNEDENLRALMLTYLWTGCRLGEVPALNWGDISLSDRFIDINKKTIIVHKKRGAEKGTAVQEIQNYLKTKSGKRRIVITPMLVGILQNHMDRQKRQAAALGRVWDNKGLVFPTSNGTIRHPRNIQAQFTRIAKKAGIQDATMHTMRHTYATRAFEAEVDIKCVSEQLGHASVKITYDTYVTIMPQKKIREIDKLNALDSMFATV